MIHSVETIYHFYLARQAYKRTRRLAWLVCAAFVSCMLLGILGGCLLWPTYPHGFTFYLKWQDALLAICWCMALVSLGGGIVVLRFLYALSRAYHDGMLTLETGNTLTGRDLSPKNFNSIFWAVATTFACFVVMLIGLCPTLLIGWTSHLPGPVLGVFSTVIVLVLSLGGLAISLPFGAFFLVGLVGGVSFCSRMGAAQTYTLNSQTILRIDSSVLAVLHPDRPESLFDLQLLTPHDQCKLLNLLRERWVEAEHSWNPLLGEEIEAALTTARHETVCA